MIEGAFNSVLFENFIYQTLRAVRTDKDLSRKKIVLLMDNAVIHKFSEMLETVRKFKVILLFNAEYSPWLNPIEQLFQYIKSHLKTQ
jgi:transposase